MERIVSGNTIRMVVVQDENVARNRGRSYGYDLGFHNEFLCVAHTIAK